MKIKSKISKLQDFEKKHLFSCIKVKKPLSSGQNWFLRQFSASIIEGMVGYENGLIFSVRALEVLFLHRLFLTQKTHYGTFFFFGLKAHVLCTSVSRVMEMKIFFSKRLLLQFLRNELSTLEANW